ncbi:MAG: hypothetical protein ACTSVI_08175 [Promethearchaeota archaeon]
MREKAPEDVELAAGSLQSPFLKKKNVIQGFFLSIPLQFLFICIPFFVWKTLNYPGLDGGYLDVLMILIVGSVVAGIIAIIGGLLFKFKFHDSKDFYINFFRVVSVLGSLMGFLFMLSTIDNKLRFSLNLGGDLDIGGIYPTALQALFTSFTIVSCAMLFFTMDIQKEDLLAVLTWALMFLIFSILPGIIAVIVYLLKSNLFISFFSLSIMLGLSSIILDKSDIDLANTAYSKSSRLQELQQEIRSPVVEVKGYSITAFITLIANFLMRYSSSFFTTDKRIQGNIMLISIIPIMVAIVTMLLFHSWLSADKFLKSKLMGSIALNFLCLAMDFLLKNPVLEMVLVQGILLGSALGLAMEPIIRSLMKARYQKHGFSNLINFSWGTMMTSAISLVLSAFFIYYKDLVEPYYKAVGMLMLSLATMPLVFSLNYSAKLNFGKRKPYHWIINLFATIGFGLLVVFAIILSI